MEHAPTEQDLVRSSIGEAMGGDINTANKALAIAQRLYQEVTQANIPSGPQGIHVLATKMDEVKKICDDVQRLDTSDSEVSRVINSIFSIHQGIAQLIQKRLS